MGSRGAPLYTLEGDNDMWQQEIIAKWLTAIHLFKDLSKEELVPFTEAAQLRIYKQKRYVFMDGDQLDRVFFIHCGKIKIYKTDLTGKEYIISILEPGDMFPYAGFFSQDNFTVNAEVLEDAHLIVMPIKNFEALLISQPKLCIEFFKVLGERIDDLETSPADISNAKFPIEKDPAVICLAGVDDHMRKYVNKRN